MDRKLWSLAGEGEHIWFLGSLVTIKVPGEAVEGRCTLIEFLAPQGLSPPLHSHPQDETFMLIDRGAAGLGLAYCAGTLCASLLAVLLVDRLTTEQQRQDFESAEGDE